MQQAETEQLPLYDKALLQFELDLFTEWYLQRHLQRELPASLVADYQQACALLVDSALAQGQVFVHRDYMPRNLMVRSEEHTSELQSRFDLVCRLLPEQ